MIIPGAMAKEDSVNVGPLPNWAIVSEPLSVPDDVRGPLFIRRQNTQAHLSKTGQRTFIASLIRILDTNALALGNLSLSWNPAAGTPVIHAVRVHRDGTARDVLADVKFEVLRREDQLEAATLDGILTATLRIPDLRVGDDLEVAYTLPSQDPTLGSDDSGLLFLVPAPPPGRFDLRLTWDSGHEPQLRHTADLAAMLKRDERGVSIAADNPTSLSLPKDAPPRYTWVRVLEYSDFATWQSVSSRIAPLFSKAAALSKDSAVKREAITIAAASLGEKARAAAALKLVQQQVRYVYVGLNAGNLTPASAEETWQRRYGDCKGKTALLLALLQELGIAAQAVLVNNSGNDDGLDQRLASPGMFDHVLVRAVIEGQTYWLDGTLPHPYAPSTDPVFSYRWVLPLSQNGAELEGIAWAPATKPLDTTLFEIDARGGFSQPAIIRNVMIKRGREALTEYYQFSSITDSQLEAAYRRELEGSSTWNEVTKVSWRFDATELASILEIEGTGPVDWDTDSRSRSLILPGGGFSPPERHMRGGDQSSSAPYYGKPEFDCRVTTVRLPTDTAEKDWSFNSTFDNAMYGRTYRRSFERRDGAIRMIRSTRTLQTEISANSAMLDNQRLAKFDNSMARIHYDAGSFDRQMTGERVPATYDLDWTVDPSACLARAASAG
ncbi:MAG: DUF3857 domain-containing protein [Novosphingobium sp.]